eukprot:6214121-Pleurochrysis_carterae.AAC.1
MQTVATLSLSSTSGRIRALLIRIGSPRVAFLLCEGYEVVGVDFLPYAHLRANAHAPHALFSSTFKRNMQIWQAH